MEGLQGMMTETRMQMSEWNDLELLTLAKYYKRGGYGEALRHLPTRSIAAIRTKVAQTDLDDLLYRGRLAEEAFQKQTKFATLGAFISVLGLPKVGQSLVETEYSLEWR